MKPAVSNRQMKLCDEATTTRFKIPSLVLMERASLCVVNEIVKYWAHPEKPQILLVCGTGNNGGDGLCTGRILNRMGYHVILVLIPSGNKLSLETQCQKETLEAYGIPVKDKIPDENFDIIIDALFGIGLTRDLTGIYREYVEKMNEMCGYKIALDIPSGIKGDTGAVMGVAFRADITVTFAFYKIGLLLYPGTEYAGKVICADIGIDTFGIPVDEIQTYLMDEIDLLQIPKRKSYSNKGTYGKVLTIAGHKNMAGAALLSGKAAAVMGAGLVHIFTEDANRIIIQQQFPEAILTTYDTTEQGKEQLKQNMDWARIIVAGPGMGMGEAAFEMIEILLAYSKVPLILDADALTILSDHLEWLKESNVPIIITPHLGEMERLTGKSIIDIQKQLLQVARDFAKEYNVICVLKDARTVIALPDGTGWINTSGNNGMATAGSGDVLTGVIAGLIAQGLKPEKAAPLGVYIHGKAGDIMVKQVGTYGLLAGDLITGIRELTK
ncbi:MAG: NAD(P)H-hydrate dehydratase [Lachnospiraceae bacterium]